MKRKGWIRKNFFWLLFAVSVWPVGVGSAAAQGTAFTYQGRLDDGANPANGTYDLRFGLYDAANAGAQQGLLLTNFATIMTNGLFLVTLDFGNQFPGTNRWLEIGVRTNGGDVFSPLTPRQQITATPYAIQAVTAGTAASVAAANVTGTIFEFVVARQPELFRYGHGWFLYQHGAGLTSLNAGNISSGTLSDARLSSNVALRNASQSFTGANTFSSLFTILNTSGSSIYEQHVDQQSGEQIVTFEREGSPDAAYWTSKIFQYADVGATYNSLFDAAHNFQAGITCYRLNGASPYFGGGDNRGLVELATVYGNHGDHGAIWELLPRKAADATISSGVFAHPLRADGYGRVMIGNIPESIHTIFVPANASLEIVGAPANTPQFHLDASPAFSGTWASGDVRFDGARFLVCQQGVTMPLPQMQQTNLTLTVATSYTWQFIWPFADTNYSVGMPTGSATFTGFHIGVKATTSVQLLFDSYSGRGEFIVQHQ